MRGVLPITAAAREQGLRRIYVPRENAAEAAVVEGIDVLAVDSLQQVASSLNGTEEITPEPRHAYVAEEDTPYGEDFADVKGQIFAKRALEIAAAGGHNVIMIGPPGSGKTMLARRMPSILPPMTAAEALETTKIHSVAGKLGASRGLMTRRPFRAPHHLASPVALIGGGQNPQPGEVSLAHNGVLFLDELPEFGHNVLEVLRQPLEDKHITISRARYAVDYPSNFTLVASMNPCPCGFYNHPTKECTCTPSAVRRYMGRISGPLLDRIDLHVEVTPVSREEMSGTEAAESSASIRRRVIAAREVQSARFDGHTYQHDDDVGHAASFLPAYGRGAGAAGPRYGPSAALGACIRPHNQGLAHDRRSRGRGADPPAARLGGHHLPLARPRGVGTLRYGASDVWADAGTEVSAGGVYGDSVVVNENLPLRCGGLGAVSHERRQQNIS